MNNVLVNEADIRTMFGFRNNQADNGLLRLILYKAEDRGYITRQVLGGAAWYDAEEVLALMNMPYVSSILERRKAGVAGANNGR